MSYKVIHRFTDLQDFNHLYNAGDDFPRIGMNVSQARLDELAGNNNKQRKPLIKKIEDDFSQYMHPPIYADNVAYTKTDINRMPIIELRKLAVDEGIENTDDMSGGDLKKLLINHYGL